MPRSAQPSGSKLKKYKRYCGTVQDQEDNELRVRYRDLMMEYIVLEQVAQAAVFIIQRVKNMEPER